MLRIEDNFCPSSAVGFACHTVLRDPLILSLIAEARSYLAVEESGDPYFIATQLLSNLCKS